MATTRLSDDIDLDTAITNLTTPNPRVTTRDQMATFLNVARINSLLNMVDHEQLIHDLKKNFRLVAEKSLSKTGDTQAESYDDQFDKQPYVRWIFHSLTMYNQLISRTETWDESYQTLANRLLKMTELAHQSTTNDPLDSNAIVYKLNEIIESINTLQQELKDDIAMRAESASKSAKAAVILLFAATAAALLLTAIMALYVVPSIVLVVAATSVVTAFIAATFAFKWGEKQFELTDLEVIHNISCDVFSATKKLFEPKLPSERSQFIEQQLPSPLKVDSGSLREQSFFYKRISLNISPSKPELTDAETPTPAYS